jgi:hypothetical protein
MIPADRYKLAFDEALSHALAGIDTTDEAEARTRVAEAVGAAQAAGEQALVTAALVESKARAVDAEREVRQRERAARERKRIEKDGRTALEKVFGSELAARVDLFAEYTLVTVHEELTLAVPRGVMLDEVRSRLRSELHVGPVEGKSAIGYQLATITDAGELDHAVKTVDDALEPIRELEARKQAASAQDRARRAQEAQAAREAAEQRRQFGVTL